MSPEELDAIREDIEIARRSPEMAMHVALDHGPELVNEVQRLSSIVTQAETLHTKEPADDLSREGSDDLTARTEQLLGDLHSMADCDSSNDPWAHRAYPTTRDLVDAVQHHKEAAELTMSALDRLRGGLLAAVDHVCCVGDDVDRADIGDGTMSSGCVTLPVHVLYVPGEQR